MKRNVTLEAQILKSIQILGEATNEEIVDHIKKNFETEIDSYELTRNIRRWLKRKCITVTKIRGEDAYSLRDVPPFFASLQMHHFVGITADKAKEVLSTLEAHYDAQKGGTIREPQYKDYMLLECTFETIDRIAGGNTSDKERKLIVQRKNGNPIIRRNQLRALFRTNARAMNITPTFFAEYVGYSDGIFEGEVETDIQHNVKVKEGLCDYEYIVPPATFKCTVRMPMKGSHVKSIDDFKRLCKIFEEAPIKGLGAYANYFGGRIRLLSINELS